MDKCCCSKQNGSCSNPINNSNKITMSYAYCYVPVQTFDKLYCVEDALKAGTLFKELYIPITEYGIQEAL